MSYENAPSTILLATHCCICGRPLRDADSVEAGIGPDCAERLGFPYGSASGKGEANVLVHKVAALKGLGPEVAPAILRLRELGFDRLAGILEERVESLKAKARIVIEEEGDRLVVTSPYVAAATPAFRAIPGRSFDRPRKANVVPASRRRELLEVLSRFYPGVLAVGPKGPFRIQGAA